jgi:uncharacterized membrane protein YqaE (UPF0057 family)
MSPSVFLICVYILVTPRIIVWMKSGFWSLDFLINVLLGLLTPTPNTILTSDKYDHRLLLLLWLPGIAHAQYVAQKPGQWPQMSNSFLIFVTIFIILFFPSGVAFVRRGVWSLDFAVSVVLWALGTASSWYLETTECEYYELRFMCFLPCMLHAYYIVVTYPDQHSDNDRNLEAGTGTQTIGGEVTRDKGATQILEVGKEKHGLVGEKAGEVGGYKP